MRKINYKSDFDAVLRLRDCKDPDKFVPWPDCDFEVVFWTSGKARCHTASRTGGTYTNCFATGDGGIHFVFDNHRMGIGTLKWEPHFALPNGIYPDGIQDVYRKADLGITLVDGEGDCPTTADVEVLVPYIKFKYEDLTDAEKAELGKPATDAAASVAELERSVETAEAGRVANEKSRVAAETARQAAEDTRQGQEAQREEAEAEREENEAERVSAESKRAEEFATWEDEIDSKADRSELSNIIAEEPLTPGNFPDFNTYTREELKKDLFIDMWENRCRFNGKDHYFGKYNRDTGFFELNEITDITYEEALQIWVLSHHAKFALNAVLDRVFGGIGHSEFQHYSLCRTYFPIISASYSGLNAKALCHYNSVVETLLFIDGYGVNASGNFESAFTSCTKLRKILSPISFPVVSNDTFYNCISLEYIIIKAYINNNSFNFQWSPKLSFESLNLLVSHARFDNTDTNHERSMTVTVHPDVYAKITDEANTEWHQVLIDAAAKNITFATT